MAGVNGLKRSGVRQPTTVSSILRLTMWLAIPDHVCILAIPGQVQKAETPRMNSSSLLIGRRGILSGLNGGGSGGWQE